MNRSIYSISLTSKSCPCDFNFYDDGTQALC